MTEIVDGDYAGLHCANETATISLQRPARHNSLVPKLLTQLHRAFERCAADEEVRAILLRAEGPSFSTGGDLDGFLEHQGQIGAYADKLVGLLHDLMCLMLECPKPIVTHVDGQVCGGALGLAICADVLLVTEKASFTPYYVDVGFSPDGGWTAILPDLIGRQRASRVQHLNASIGPEEAVDWGLAAGSGSAADVDSILRSLCSFDAASQASTKRLLRPTNYRERLDAERHAFVKCIERPGVIDRLRRFQQGMLK